MKETATQLLTKVMYMYVRPPSTVTVIKIDTRLRSVLKCIRAARKGNLNVKHRQHVAHS